MNFNRGQIYFKIISRSKRKNNYK